jgi:glyoxylase-like metal-dependent hydrolase (beta-lactamase superfamily II)
MGTIETRPSRSCATLLGAALFGASLLCTAVYADTRTTHVAGNIYMISGAGGNVTVSAGDSGIMLIDSGAAGASGELLAAVRGISNGAIRYIVNTSVLPEHRGGNVAMRQAGATFTGGNATVVGGVDEGAALIGHENGLLRLALAGEPAQALPTETFFVPKIDLYFNGEPVEIVYQPNAVDDTSLIVHFRRSDVIGTGDVLRFDTFPYFDVANGGSINGVLDSLNFLVELAVSDKLAEGGTLLVPGHGRIADEGDLVRYRDMNTVIRDRVQALIDRGQSLPQIQAANVTLDYESRYGAERGEWTTAMFVEAVYRSLVDDPTAT